MFPFARASHFGYLFLTHTWRQLQEPDTQWVANTCFDWFASLLVLSRTCLCRELSGGSACFFSLLVLQLGVSINFVSQLSATCPERRVGLLSELGFQVRGIPPGQIRSRPLESDPSGNQACELRRLDLGELRKTCGMGSFHHRSRTELLEALGLRRGIRFLGALGDFFALH